MTMGVSPDMDWCGCGWAGDYGGFPIGEVEGKWLVGLIGD
jgi:hypothetical protein